MKPRTSLILAIILFLGCFVAIPAVLACSCSGGANPCGFFRKPAGVAFIGTVEDVVAATEKYGKPIKGRARKIKIKVDETFKGMLPNEVITSDDGFSCDNYPFQLGKSYLIYSSGVLENTQNILPVGLCSGTVPVESAQESINFLRQMKSGIMPSILYGKLQRVVNGQTNFYEPLARTKIVLTKIYATENGQYKEPRKNEMRIETVTDQNGEYSFPNLGIGTYKLSAILPSDLWMPESREFSAGGVPSCDTYSLYTYANGSISGNVVNSDGSPARLALAIEPLDGSTRYFYPNTRTDEKGNFTFSGLNEGRYRIYAGLTSYSLDGARTYVFSSDFPFPKYYFPNTLDIESAQIITLGHAQKIQDIDLKMPTAPIRRTVSGTLIWPGGNGVDKGVIYYRLRKEGVNSPRYVFAKPDGTFSFQIYDEFDYEISAVNNSQSNYGYADWTTLDKSSSDKPLKVVIKPRK